MIHSALFFGLPLIILAIFLFFEAPLNFIFDQKSLSCSCSDKLGTFLFKFFFLSIEVVLLIIHLCTLSFKILSLGQQLEALNLDLVSDLRNVGLRVSIAMHNHLGDSFVIALHFIKRSIISIWSLSSLSIPSGQCLHRSKEVIQVEALISRIQTLNGIQQIDFVLLSHFSTIVTREEISMSLFNKRNRLLVSDDSRLVLVHLQEKLHKAFLNVFFKGRISNKSLGELLSCCSSAELCSIGTFPNSIESIK